MELKNVFIDAKETSLLPELAGKTSSVQMADVQLRQELITCFRISSAQITWKSLFLERQV